MNIRRVDENTYISCSLEEMYCLDFMVKAMSMTVQNHSEFLIYALGSLRSAYCILAKIYESIESKDYSLILSKEEFNVLKQSFNYMILGSNDISKLEFFIGSDGIEEAKKIFDILFQ